MTWRLSPTTARSHRAALGRRGWGVFEPGRVASVGQIIRASTKVRSTTTTARVSGSKARHPARRRARRRGRGGRDDAWVAAPQPSRRAVAGSPADGTGRRHPRRRAAVPAAGRDRGRGPVSASLLQVGQDGLLLETMPIPSGDDPAPLLDARPADPGPPGRLGRVQVTGRSTRSARSTWPARGSAWAPAWAGQLFTVRVDVDCSTLPRGVLLKTGPVPSDDVVRSGPPHHPDPTASRWRQHQPEPSGPASTGTDKRARSCAGPPRPPKCRSGPSARGDAGVDVGAPSPRPARQRRTSRPSRCGRARRARVGLLAWCSPRYLLRLVVPGGAAAATTAAPAGPWCRQARPACRSRVQARRRHPARAPPSRLLTSAPPHAAADEPIWPRRPLLANNQADTVDGVGFSSDFAGLALHGLPIVQSEVSMELSYP